MQPLIFDGHLDLAMNALEYRRDLTRSLAAVRRRERLLAGPGAPGVCTVTLPEMVRGRVFLCMATLYARARRRRGPGGGWFGQGAARAAACGQLGYYQSLERLGWLKLITSPEQLQEHVESWKGAAGDSRVGPADASPPVGAILLMECADPLLKPAELHEWVKWGLRAVGPAHIGPNVYAHGTGARGGMTAPGLQLLREMEKAGLVLDVSHLSDRAFWEALDAFAGPAMASHSNCRGLSPGARQLSDRQIKAVTARGGVVGIALHIDMLSSSRARERGRAGVSCEEIVQHIDRVCQLAGDAGHVGLGSDLDGGFGRERIPKDLDSIADLAKVGDALARRGYRDEDVAAVLSGNWLRFWTRSLHRFRERDSSRNGGAPESAPAEQGTGNVAGSAAERSR